MKKQEKMMVGEEHLTNLLFKLCGVVGGSLGLFAFRTGEQRKTGSVGFWCILQGEDVQTDFF